MDDESLDRFFECLDEYKANSTVPIASWLCPNPAQIGFTSPGSALSVTTLSKKEWNKINK